MDLDCQQLLFDGANTEVICFKVLVVGEPSVGKTSLVKRYIDDTYDERYKSTIGVAHSDKTIFWSKATAESKAVVIKIQFWDLAGQDRLNNVARVYYRGAAGALCVCDLLREESRQHADNWKDMVHENATRQDGSQAHPPCILVVNKMDLLGKGPSKSWLINQLEYDHGQAGDLTAPIDESIYSDSTAMSYSKEFVEKLEEISQKSGFDTGFPVSVKLNLGIDKAMRKLIELMLKRYREENRERRVKEKDETVRLDRLMIGSQGNVEDPDDLLNLDPDDRITANQAARASYCNC